MSDRCVWLLRDALARGISTQDALEVGDVELAVALLDDLTDDLWHSIEELEREQGAA
jgi:hypothetical protein